MFCYKQGLFRREGRIIKHFLSLNIDINFHLVFRYFAMTLFGTTMYKMAEQSRLKVER